MKTFFSPSYALFYPESLFGRRRVLADDPTWTRPRTSAVVLAGQSYRTDAGLYVNDTGAPVELPDVPDWSIAAPQVEIDNPNCSIPADALDVSEEEYIALRTGMQSGGRIEVGADGRPVLVMPTLPSHGECVSAALLQIDRDTDRIILETIGARAEEYRQAEADALGYQSAGYAGPVPAFVADHQAAKGTWTAQQAADDILATAAAWRAAQAQIRANRLMCKELARRSVDDTGLKAALAQWAGFVVSIRASLGLSPA